MSINNDVLLEKEELGKPKAEIKRMEGEPTAAFIGAAWSALLVGVIAYLIGLYNATMQK